MPPDLSLLGSAPLPGARPTERRYVLSLGSQQGNRHVHWHVVPLPPGVPYHEQQTALFDVRNGWREFPPDELRLLAASVGEAMRV
jgi:diadenosine tetraphosphate (Ap4A) HIT family hydrolase